MANNLRENIPAPIADALDAATALPGSRIVDWAERHTGHAFDTEGYVREIARERGLLTDFIRGDLAEPYRHADPQRRTLEAPERRFMLRHCGRMEAELRWLVENNPTVRDAWDEAKRGGLSETSAAELAVLALARENEDLRRQLERTRLVPVTAED